MSDRKGSTSSEELVAAAPDHRNWKGIAIALLVIGVVCSLIGTAVILLTPDEIGRVNKPRLHLKEVLDHSFSPRHFNGTWISGHELLYKDNGGNLVLMDVENESKKVILPDSIFKQRRYRHYMMSNDRKYIALVADISKIFRYSNVAEYVIYDLKSRIPVKLPSPNNGKAHHQLFKWGPKGNALVHVYKNNVYYYASVEDVKIKNYRQITQNGRLGVIYNGIADWLYEEEILADTEAIWWSPNGYYICFATFNDSQVRSISFPFYGMPSDETNQYTRLISIKYPKPGTRNPSATLFVADVRKTNIIPHQVSSPNSISKSEHYFTKTSWIDESTLSIIWMNRSQNFSIITSCSEKSWTCFPTQEVKASGEPDGKSWIEMYDQPIYSKNGEKYFIRLPVADGDAGEFQNVAKIITKDKRRTYVTHGKFVVTKVLAYSDENEEVYYISTREGKPGERHVFSVGEETFPKPQSPKCLTCDLGDECLYNNAIFSPDTKYYVLECLGPRVPYSALYRTRDNQLVTMMDLNQDVQKRINNRAMPQTKTKQVPLPGGFKSQVRLLLPPDFRDTDVIRYPLLVFVYGGPNSQLVSEKFEVTWGHYLASQRSMIVATIDGRGSGFQGDKMVNQLYRRLGTPEVEDQLSVTRYLTEHVKFIDPEYVAMWGWSYGGYVTAMALTTESQNVFQCGISVAPVTSWLYYDSVYTERYMQTPAENKWGYEKSDVLLRAGNMKGKKYFLIHGTADDNVHFQQSMLLAKALNRAGIMYRSQVYPDENHFISRSKIHLYKSIEDFLDYCFPEDQLDTYALKQLSNH